MEGPSKTVEPFMGHGAGLGRILAPEGLGRGFRPQRGLNLPKPKSLESHFLQFSLNAFQVSKLTSLFRAVEVLNLCLTMKSFRLILSLAACLLLTSRAFCSLVDEGNAKAAKGDFDGAIADYNKAIDLNGNDAVVYTFRGNAKRNKGDLDGAMADMDKAIALNTNYVDAYISRGVTRQTKLDFDGAIADFKKAIELKPEDVVNLNNCIGFANWESAQLKPVIYYHRGIGEKEGNGNLDAAITDFNKAIELNPDYAEAYNSRGYAKRCKGDLNGAIADYSKAIKLKPDFAWAYNNRGWIEFLETNYDSAISDATYAIQLNSTNRSFYDTRGWARYSKGDSAGALEDCEKAVGLSRVGTWQAVETQGLVNLIRGDYNMAFQQLNNSFQNDPSKRYLLPFIEKAKAKLNSK